jgi:hypothetical protein
MMDGGWWIMDDGEEASPFPRLIEWEGEAPDEP